MMKFSRKYFAILLGGSFLSFWAGYSAKENNLFAEKVSIGTGDCQITFIWDQVQYRIANGETEKISISEAFSNIPNLKTFRSLHQENLHNQSRLPFSCYYKDNKFVYGFTPGHFAALLKDFDYESLRLVEEKDFAFPWDEHWNCGIWDCYEDKDYRYGITELSSQNFMLEGKSVRMKK